MRQQERILNWLRDGNTLPEELRYLTEKRIRLVGELQLTQDWGNDTGYLQTQIATVDESIRTLRAIRGVA